MNLYRKLAAHTKHFIEAFVVDLCIVRMIWFNTSLILQFSVILVKAGVKNMRSYLDRCAILTI